MSDLSSLKTVGGIEEHTGPDSYQPRIIAFGRANIAESTAAATLTFTNVSDLASSDLVLATRCQPTSGTDDTTSTISVSHARVASTNSVIVALEANVPSGKAFGVSTVVYRP